MIRGFLKDADPRFVSFSMIAFVAITVCAMTLYGFKPGYLNYIKNRESLELLQNRMDDRTQLQQMITDQKQKIITMRHDLNGESGSLPMNEMESYLIGRLQHLSWEADVQLVGVRPGSSKRVIQFDEISFEVSVIGSYYNLYDWLNRINSSLGFVIITKHKIQPHKRSEDGELSMDMTLVFYRVRA